MRVSTNSNHLLVSDALIAFIPPVVIDKGCMFSYCDWVFRLSFECLVNVQKKNADIYSVRVISSFNNHNHVPSDFILIKTKKETWPV